MISKDACAERTHVGSGHSARRQAAATARLASLTQWNQRKGRNDTRRVTGSKSNADSRSRQDTMARKKRHIASFGLNFGKPTRNREQRDNATLTPQPGGPAQASHSDHRLLRQHLSSAQLDSPRTSPYGIERASSTYGSPQPSVSERAHAPKWRSLRQQVSLGACSGSMHQTL